jgi:uncharacterized membrane protein YeaQ/YmgE (transglycosylase-associated protein family)
MVNMILWLFFGALVGWLANSVMRTDTRPDPLLNIGIGIAGCALGTGTSSERRALLIGSSAFT